MRKKIFGEVKYEDLKEFIEPISINISIPLHETTNFYNGYTTKYIKNRDKIKDIYEEVLSNMPVTKSKMADANYCITYNTHATGYDFRINPIDFINSVFKILKVKNNIPFINLDNENGMSYFKDYAISCIRDISDRYVDVGTLMVANELLNSLNDICDLYYEDINSIIEQRAIPKDTLFYLAYRSLDLYEKTKNEKYAVLPYQYYHEISHMQTTPYPHKIGMGYNGNKVWYDDFRFKYRNLIGKEYVPETFKFNLDNHEVLLAWEILKPGAIDRQIRELSERSRYGSGLNHAKYQKLFDAKINYYMNSPYRKYILGKYGLDGYIGFVYENEYLVFDKFHNRETEDLQKRTILTHDEAIYALPSDKFGILKGSKQAIMLDKKDDTRIKKINHTTNLSFLNRLDNIITGPNVSTRTFDEVIEEEKQKMLIKTI